MFTFKSTVFLTLAPSGDAIDSRVRQCGRTFESNGNLNRPVLEKVQIFWGLPKGLLGGMLEFWIRLYKSYAKHFSKLCLSVAWSLLTRCSFAWSSEHYRAQKAVFFTYEVKEFKQFADNMIRSTVNEIKWTSLLARSLNLIAYISSSFPAHCSLGDWQVVLDKYFTSSSSHIVPLSGGGCISLVDWFKSKEKKETQKRKKKCIM